MFASEGQRHYVLSEKFPLIGKLETHFAACHCRALASQPWSGGEVAELAERRKRLLLYLLRSPLLDLVTR